VVLSSYIASVIAQPDLRTATPRGGPSGLFRLVGWNLAGMCAQTVMSSKETGRARALSLAPFLPSD